MNWIAAIQKLSTESRQRFFTNPLEMIRDVFIESPELYGDIDQSFCDYINWENWDRVCLEHGLWSLQDLPAKCHMFAPNPENRARLLLAIDLLTTSPKITKTFTDLL